MQLDAVRGDTTLTVEDVEEAHARDGGAASERTEPTTHGHSTGCLESGSGSRHLSVLARFHRALALGIGKLDDHAVARVGGISDHQVNVPIVLERDAHEHCLYPEGARLDASDARRRR